MAFFHVPGCRSPGGITSFHVRVRINHADRYSRHTGETPLLAPPLGEGPRTKKGRNSTLALQSAGGTYGEVTSSCCELATDCGTFKTKI